MKKGYRVIATEHSVGAFGEFDVPEGTRGTIAKDTNTLLWLIAFDNDPSKVIAFHAYDGVDDIGKYFERKYNELQAVLCEIVEYQPMCADRDGWPECAFCMSSHGEPHEPNCPILKAQVLLGLQPASPATTKKDVYFVGLDEIE